MIINSLVVLMVTIILAVLFTLGGFPNIGLALLIVSIALVSIGSVTTLYFSIKGKSKDE